MTLLSFAKKKLSRNTELAAETLFALFGMWYAKEGSKAMDFGPCFKTLGLLVKLGNALLDFP